MAEKKKKSVRKKTPAVKKISAPKKTNKKAPAKKPAKKAPAKKAIPKKFAPRPRQRRAASTNRRLSLRSRIVLGAIILLAMFLSFIIYIGFVRSAIPEDRSYVVAPGASVAGVASDLNQGAEFKFFIKMFGGRIMAGGYDLPKGLGVYGLARMLSEGEIASISVTIPEGLTVKQIIKLLNKNQNLTGDIAAGAYNDGDLFPDTYIVAKGTNRTAILDLMAKKMTAVRAEFSNAFAPPLRTWNEVITLASIVQKETPKIEEMPVVAGVYLNRLKKNMRLQADPTVVYAITNGLGDMEERRLYSKHLETASPYNTYRNRGLPPAPIANVGMDAIRAVLSPARTNYYFFVADGTGGHVFAETLEEHNINRAAWREIRRNKK